MSRFITDGARENIQQERTRESEYYLQSHTCPLPLHMPWKDCIIHSTSTFTSPVIGTQVHMTCQHCLLKFKWVLTSKHRENAQKTVFSPL